MSEMDYTSSFIKLISIIIATNQPVKGMVALEYTDGGSTMYSSPAK